MKVLLITPKFSKTNVRWMPLGLCYLASSLIANGHEVKIFDRFAQEKKLGEQMMNEQMMNEIIEFTPDYIGINAVSPYIHDTVEIVHRIKESFDGKIVLGGHHPTAMPELTLKRMPEVDAIIKGEGERALVMYVESKDYDSIPGLCWYDGESYRQNDVDVIPDLDELQMPSYDLLDMDFYLKKNAKTIDEFYLSVATIMISRGCYNRCIYCTETLTYSKGVRYHSTEYIVKNIEYLMNNYSVEALTFIDSDFLADRNRIEEVCHMMIQDGISDRLKFCIQTRVTHLDASIIKLLRKAGCIKIELGIETINENQLKDIRKNITMKQSEEAIKLCNENGIKVQVNLIRGMENEKVDSLYRTMNWIREMKVDNISWGLLMILPGSKLYEDKGKQFFEKNDWTEANIDNYYKTDHLSNTSVDEYSKFSNGKYKWYKKFRHHQNFIRNNTLTNCWKYYFERTFEKINSTISA